MSISSRANLIGRSKSALTPVAASRPACSNRSMDVRPVGAGPGGADLSRVIGPAGPAPKLGIGGSAALIPNAVDAAGLAALSESDIAQLMALFEPQLSPQTTARLGELLQIALAATGANEVTRALSAVTELAALDPLRAEAVRTEPGLEPVRPQVDSLLAHLTNVTRLDAEGRVSQAAQVVEAAGGKPLAGWDARPEALLLIGNRLLDAGGYANSVRAAQVAQAIMDAAHWAPAASAVPLQAPERTEIEEAGRPVSGPTFQKGWTELRRQAPARIKRLCRKAPLLVLLLAWLAVGLVGGAASLLGPEFWSRALIEAGFGIWGLGFLALVLFGFYMRVRNVRL